MISEALSLQSVSKSYVDRRALRGIDVTVPEGDIFGLVGPDGAGKTTTIRIAMGIIKPDAGNISLLGSGEPYRMRRFVGYVPQLFSLYLNLTVIENINLYGALYGSDPEIVARMAKEMLTKTGLWEFRNRFAGALSGGMKQKLALAVGLVHKPKVLFLDEPTTGVDPLARREFWAMLYEFNADGVTIIVSTPYMDEAELCTNIAFLNRGKIIAEGDTAEVLKNYRYSLLDIGSADRRIEEALSELPDVVGVNLFGTHYHVEITGDDGNSRDKICRKLAEIGLADIGVTFINPSLEDLFVSLADNRDDDDE